MADTLKLRILAMRHREPYGKDVFSACGVLVNGPAKRVNKANQDKVIKLAEDAYADMSLICKPARLIYDKYGTPFPLIVAAIYEGCAQDGGKGAAFARAVLADAGPMAPRGWPQILAGWLLASKQENGGQWDRVALYRAVHNVAQAKVTGVDSGGITLEDDGSITMPQEEQEGAFSLDEDFYASNRREENYNLASAIELIHDRLIELANNEENERFKSELLEAIGELRYARIHILNSA